MKKYEDKPVVEYTGTEEFIYSPMYDSNVAILYNVLNHPKLGKCPWVITTSIQKIHDNGDIETKNTIYRKVED